MKKAMTLLLVAALLFATLTGCAMKNTTTPEPTATPESTPTSESEMDDPRVMNFPAVDPRSEGAEEFYRYEVKSRLEREDYFSEDERALLLECGYRVYDSSISLYNPVYGESKAFAYPILVRTEGHADLWYSWGNNILRERILGVGDLQFGNYIGSSHLSDEVKESGGLQILKTSDDFLLVYQELTGIISAYRFGEQIASKVGQPGAKYCGQAQMEGYLFRKGGELFALRLFDWNPRFDTWEFQDIATGVAYVLDSDYAYNSDARSQPLLLMEDGTIRVYVGWSEYGQANDPAHLLELTPRDEGGYHR